MDSLGHEAQHRFGDVEPPQFGLRFLLAKHTREAALAAAHIEHPLPAQRAEVFANQLDVVNARIDGGGKMLLVARGFIERGLDPGAQLRGELRAGFSGKEPLPVQCQAYARVRKIGSPTFWS